MAKKTKEDPIFGLSKLPNKAFIKVLKGKIAELEVERGKDQSYILELEHKLEEYNNLNNEEIIHKNLKRELEENKKLVREQKKQLHQYLKEQKKLIHENHNLKTKLQNAGRTN